MASKKRAKKPKIASTEKALEQLVSQFAQPLAFLRELVQNSMDASTEVIEVEVDYDAEAECCFVRVRDTGVGMDRAIIDTKLTRLFSSSKENDLTKIGKFGIGFVSIFAINPKLVVLETGRDGESWRLLFKPDRSFERRELKTPVEGTCVTVFTPKGRQELAALQKDCRDTVAFWCRHSEVEIHFNGEVINQPFELPDHPFTYRHKIEGTEVVVAPCQEPVGFQGYYNRGLTLLEGPGSPLPHVSFKLRSRYLEHTLSRDNILYDQHYERAMAEVRLAAYRDMPQELVRRLAQQDLPQLWRLARIVHKYPDPVPKTLHSAEIFPSNGRRLKAAKLGSTVFIHPVVDDFWRAAESTGATIVLAEPGDDKAGLLTDLGCQPAKLTSSLLYFSLIASPTASEAALLEGLRQVDKVLRRLVLIEGLSVPPSWEGRFCGYLTPESRVAALPDCQRPGWGLAIAILQEHSFWQKLVDLHSAQPQLAYALAMRKIGLELGLGTEREGKLFSRLVQSLRDSAAPA